MCSTTPCAGHTSTSQHICDQVWAIDPDIKVVTHGYGYAPPDGRGVLNFPFGFRFIGPWLRPALASKGHVDRLEGERIVRAVIDAFNSMLLSFTADHAGRVRHVDLRADIQSDEWVNELHLTNAGFEKVARRFDEAITQLLG